MWNKSLKCRSCCQKKWRKVYSKEYYRLKQERYNRNNREKINKIMIEYRKTHKVPKELNNERHRKWVKTENWKISSARTNAKYRYKLRDIKQYWSYKNQEWIDLCNKYENKCVCCKKETKLTIDHIIPLSKWWLNIISNLQPLCKSCNSSKRNKTICYI